MSLETQPQEKLSANLMTDGYVSISTDLGQLPNPGTTVRYRCNVKQGDHFVQRPQWFRNGQLIDPAQQGGVYVDVVNDMSSELVITDLQSDDLGIYYCTGGPDVEYINVEFAELECTPACENGGTCIEGECLCNEGYTGETCSEQASDFIVIGEPVGQIPEVMGNATFLCEVPESSSYGSPRWLDPTGQEISVINQGRRSSPFTEDITPFATQLHFVDARFRDTGTYTCRVGPFSKLFNITFAAPACYPPCINGVCTDGRCECPVGLTGIQCNMPDNSFILVTEPEGQVPIVGQNQSFVCEVSRENPYGIPVWLDREGAIIESLNEGGNSHVHMEPLTPYATRLFINDLRLTDAGMYVCKVGPVEKRFTVLAEPIPCDRPCFYGGRCVNGACECQEGFVGDQCETPS
ncbi:uncharacterized protein [Diadema antillarum]|uniref:uncharacterized protein n=1 Tax=Diadema antillarum TaxID=105358 RepID=UPI003A8848B4